MSRRSGLTLALVLVLSVITAGAINVMASENLPVLICLLLFPFVAGLMQPRAAWRWGLLVGLSVMLSQFTALAINYRVVDAPRYPLTLAVLALPALAAAYAGALLGRLLSARDAPAR